MPNKTREATYLGDLSTELHGLALLDLGVALEIMIFPGILYVGVLYAIINMGLISLRIENFKSRSYKMMRVRRSGCARSHETMLAGRLGCEAD